MLHACTEGLHACNAAYAILPLWPYLADTNAQIRIHQEIPGCRLNQEVDKSIPEEHPGH